MSQIIAVKIDVTKIDKSKLFAGKKGKYLDCVLIPSPNDQYGNDFFVAQSVTKEEREAGTRGTILGNAKFVGGRSEQREDKPKKEAKPAKEENLDEDVPF